MSECFSPDNPPDGLKLRGVALWKSLVTERDLSGGGADLALEACRIADRLDKLDGILVNPDRVWTYLRRQAQGDTEDTKKYVVVMTGALAEARQQAIVLRQIVAGLPVKGDDPDDPDGTAFLESLGRPGVPA